MKKNKKSLFQRPALAKRALTTIIPMVLAQSALGVITVHFVETGPDVVVSFNGTLQVDPLLTDDLTTQLLDVGGTVNDRGILARNGNAYTVGSVGAHTLTSLVIVNQITVLVGDVGGFGYVNSNLFWGLEHITGGSVGAVSELTATGGNATFTLPGQSLASLNADGIAQNTVLWTANTTGDTIVFSGGGAVPEPSSLLLCGLSALGLLLRRR